MKKIFAFILTLFITSCCYGMNNYSSMNNKIQQNITSIKYRQNVILNLEYDILENLKNTLVIAKENTRLLEKISGTVRVEQPKNAK